MTGNDPRVQTNDLEDFFENGAVGLHIVGNDGKILRVNRAELNMLGYAAEDYVGHDIREFHVDKPVIEDILARLAQGDKLDRHPARLRAKDDSIRYVLITSSAQFQNGRFVNSRCFTFDITEAKQAESRIQANERRFQAVLEALPVAVYITDALGQITFFNEAAVKLAGRRPVLGTDGWCVSWRLFRLDGSPLPHDQCPMAITLRERRAVRGEEAIAQRPDGSRVRFAAYPTPLFDDQGDLTGAVNMLLDVTERHLADLQSAHLAAIVASSDDAIISKTMGGIVTTWNAAAARIFGYSAREMIGQSITRIIPPGLHEEEREILARLQRGERIEHYETLRLGKDGRRIDISLTVSPIRDRYGNLVGASKVSRDITARKQGEKLQILLMSELNHRVKNTLATVQAIATQTIRSALSPGAFIASFTGRLQALARAHTLLTDNTWEGAEVQALVRDQILLGALDDDRISYDGPPVWLDPQAALHLALIFHELGTNARKHGALSSPDGRLSIAWSVHTNGDRSLHLHWKEIGGPPAAPPSTGGFGTALIVRTVQAHGGQARFDYQTEGVTCEITIPLPEDRRTRGAYRLFAPRSTEPAVEPHHVDLTMLQGKRILVIEDEPLVVLDLTNCLIEAGCEVVGPALAFDRAAKLIDVEKFDATLLDANLGGRHVDVLAAELFRRQLPFAFITGYGTERLPEDFWHAPVLSKPFAHHQVLQLIAGLLSQPAVNLPARSPS